MYSISEFGHMIADERRTDAYVEALRRALTTDSVVLDIGTGTGIFAALACRFGARHVYAVEPNDAIHIARRIAQENGVADRITFIQDISTRLTLPEQADVVISDLHGVLPFFQFNLPSVMDARQRHLKQGGTLIPQQDTLWATVVTAPKQYDDYINAWDGNKYNLRMSAARHIVTNVWGRGNIKPDDFLVVPQICSLVDYRSVTSTDLSSTLSWTVEQPGVAHGLSAWFDTLVADGVELSNAPGQPELVYGNAFFPWTQPVQLSAGDQIQVWLQANLIGDDYVWRWDTRIHEAGNPTCVKANFKQSTFHSTLLSPTQLAKKTANYVATLTQAGKIDRFILNLMDGHKPLGDIANELAGSFPDQFPTRNDALGRVGKLSEEYSH